MGLWSDFHAYRPAVRIGRPTENYALYRAPISLIAGLKSHQDTCI